MTTWAFLAKKWAAVAADVTVEAVMENYLRQSVERIKRKL